MNTTIIFVFRFQVKTVRYFRTGLFSQPNTPAESNILVLLTAVGHIWMYQSISESTVPYTIIFAKCPMCFEGIAE